MVIYLFNTEWDKKKKVVFHDATKEIKKVVKRKLKYLNVAMFFSRCYTPSEIAL